MLMTNHRHRGSELDGCYVKFAVESIQCLLSILVSLRSARALPTTDMLTSRYLHSSDQEQDGAAGKEGDGAGPNGATLYITERILSRRQRALVFRRKIIWSGRMLQESIWYSGDGV